jgi:hypothetical protein
MDQPCHFDHANFVTVVQHATSCDCCATCDTGAPKLASRILLRATQSLPLIAGFEFLTDAAENYGLCNEIVITRTYNITQSPEAFEIKS